MTTTRRWTERLRAEIWKRFHAGLKFQQICEGLRVALPSVYSLITRAGGFAPRVRKRRSTALTACEREEISRSVAAGRSVRCIAAELGRPPSTVSRELRRNGGRDGYRATSAEKRAWQQACRPQPCKLASDSRLQGQVAAKLMRRWSPQQIAGWLRLRYPDDVSMRVSHETIYRSLFVQARGAFRSELRQYLRTHRMYRRPRGVVARSRAEFDGISISERPAEVEDRAVPGHWEGDLLMGTVASCIAVLVERSTRFVMLVKVPSKQTKAVTTALAKHIKRLPAQLRQSLTWDRGSELMAHKQFSIDADIDVYFCDPHSPWQRGSNENTNGLLRQYFPRGTSVAKYDQRQLDRVARELNGRPRQTLGFRSPAEVLNELLQ